MLAKMRYFFWIWLCVLGLVGCGNKEEEKVAVYSFQGENAYFAVKNGRICLGEEEVFFGGYLEILQADTSEEMVSYSTTFYTYMDGEQRTILSNSIQDQSGGVLAVEGVLGTIAGKGAVTGNGSANGEKLFENLWFVLKTTNLHGEEYVYPIQLTVTEEASSLAVDE